ncbi:Do family serine endopeptidase [Paenochrobactrum sp. BZR 588]|uniref:Do family serine endopeptidase n=1 Tax=unclassified Paenochrobactrum TaxID=2639760 RepID=UPI003852976D
MVSALKTGLVRNTIIALSLTALALPFDIAFNQAVAQSTAAELHAKGKGPASVADLAEGLIDAVVNISTSQTIKGEGDGVIQVPDVPEGSPFQEFFDDYFKKKDQNGGDERSGKVQSLGSGFVVDADKGFIVTNNHVIADADEIIVNFNDGSKLKAELVGTDTKTDIALLKVDPKKRKLVAVQLGHSETARIGDWVMAIGNPFGLGGTVTVGIISARKRDINSGPYDSFIQTDAAINRGNSGGPLFDMDGNVIGINTAIISPSGGSIGIGFAIPSEIAASVLDQLKEFGEVRRGWLGVRIQPISDDMLESLSLKEVKGALVAGLIDGAEVDNKALKAGDVILSFDGKAVEAARDLPRLVAESAVDDVVDIVIQRDGKEQTVKVKLGRMVESDKASSSVDEEDEEMMDGDELETEDQALPPALAPSQEDAETSGDKVIDPTKPEAPAAPAINVLGMKLGMLDDDMRGIYGIDDEVEGVVVQDVVPNSAAATKRIEAGEVIVDIGQEVMKTPQDVKKRIEALQRQGRKNALIMLASRSGELRFVTIRID